MKHSKNNYDLKVERLANMLKNKKLLFAPVWAENKYYDGYQYWYPSFKKLFKNIILFDPQKNARLYGNEEMNRKFLEIVKNEKPDYIFMWMITYEFFIETLVKIREISPKTKIINFFGDDDIQFESFSIYYSLFLDCGLVLPQPNQYYKEFKIRNIFYTIGKNLDNYKPLNLKKKYDVTFIGTPKADRCELVRFLLKNNIKIDLFGWGWHNYPEFKEIYHGPLDPKDLIKIVNESKINLCFSKNMFGEPHTVGRVFEFGACNSFILVDYVPIYDRFFKEGREIVMFRNEEELKNKVDYYLKNEKEREKIAENMYHRIIKKYDLDKNLYKLFKLLESGNKNLKYRPLQPLKKRVITLDIHQLELSNRELNDKLRDFDYISINNGNAEILKYKDYLQTFSLERSGKDISCCDYLVSSEFIGDFLVFDSKTAFKLLERTKFNEFIDINQLMMTKEFFLNNIDKVKNLCKNNTSDLINENNSIFVSIPLVRLKNFKKTDYSIMIKAYQMKFIEELFPLAYNRKIFSSIYPYKLFIFSLNRKLFILKHLFGFLHNKKRFNALLEAYKK